MKQFNLHSCEHTKNDENREFIGSLLTSVIQTMDDFGEKIGSQFDVRMRMSWT